MQIPDWLGAKTLRFLLLGIAICLSQASAKTPSGTVITNQAEITWFDTEDGLVKRAFSNLASVVVRKQYSLVLVSNNIRHTQASKIVSLPHRLTNTGNTSASYELRIRHELDDSGNFREMSVYGDTNANGAVEAGEPLWEPVTCSPVEERVSCFHIPKLDPDELVEFVIAGTTPAEAKKDDIYRLNIRAFPQNYGDILAGLSGSANTRLSADLIEPNALPADWVNNDLVDIIEGAVLNLTKTATPICGVPVKAGETITYKIGFSNVGDDKPTARDILIDEGVLQGVLLEDELPANVTLTKNPLPITAPNQSIPLIQLQTGMGSDRWIRFTNWNGSDAVSKVGLYIPAGQMQPNQSGKLQFQVTINPNVTATTIYNQAKFDLADGASPEFLSNNICTSIEPGNTKGGEGNLPDETFDATIRFLTPVLDVKKSITQSGGVPDFYNNAHFEDAPIYHLDSNLNDYKVIRDGVYIDLTSSAVNKDEDTAETIVVKVTSGTGDTLQVTLVETGTNTGIFRSLHPILMSENEKGEGRSCPSEGVVTPNFAASEPNCVLNGAADGNLTVTATVRLDETRKVEVLEDAALIDPLGVVFDSAYNTPVKGASVWIRNADGSVALDPLTDTPYEPQVTDDDGRYQFPFLSGGQSYYLDVVPPPQYSFPSIVAESNFPTRTVNEYSYGKDGYKQVAGSGIFDLTRLLIVDIPLDPELNTDLSLHKTASLSEVSIGSSLSYSVRIQNHSKRRLFAIKLQDSLPRGFNYVAGSATLNGQPINDPEGAPRPNLTFTNLPFIAGAADGVLDNKEHTLSYRVRTTAGAVGSDGVNTIVADGRTETSFPIKSNESQAKVKIQREGVLQDKAIIFGKVYIDADCNNVQNGGEWPIGGVKLFLEDGTWVITDANGQYSVYGIEPGMHAIKMDSMSLPKGLRFKPTDNRQMADPHSRLVDLTAGEFHRADFAAACPKTNRDAIKAEIQARNTGQTDWMLENAQKYDPDKKINRTDTEKASDIDGDISSGSSHEGSFNTAKKAKRVTTGYSIQLQQFRERALAEKALADLSKSLQKEAYVHQAGDFYTVRFGFDLDKKSMKARMRELTLPSKSKVVATIYEQISDDVADRLETPRGLETMPLAKEAVKHVTKKQAKAGVWLWPKAEVSLDGRFMVVVRKGLVPTLKVNGKVVPKAQLGERIENRRERAQVVAWYGVQLQPGENEVEVVAKDMFGNNRILAKRVFTRPISAEKLHLEMRTNQLAADGGRSYLPISIKLLDANGYLARGVNFVTIEASDGQWVERDVQDQVQGRQVRVVNGLRTVHLRSSERSGKIRVRASDGSMRDETEVTQVAPLRPLIAIGVVDVGGKVFKRGRSSPDLMNEDEFNASAAAFMKGKVRGDMHLTLSVDTDKKDDAELFRDINPNKSYPIHGDSSQRGYQAQSRSKVYAKLEKDQDSVMWGDFVTDGKSMNEDVTRVQRTLTGASVLAKGGATEWQFFVSELDENHITERIRGGGVALNYKLSKSPIVTNSDTLDVITVSRDNPGVVLNVTSLSRFGDYTLDSVTGELSFSEVVPIADEDLNPVYILASYDVEGDGNDYTVAGARIRHEIKPGFKLGLNYTVDQHETTGFELYGVTLDYEDDDGLTVRGSLGQMTHEDISKDSGIAGRLYLSRKWADKSITSITLGRASRGFTNSAAGISENREELRIKHEMTLSTKMGADIEAIHSKNLDTGDVEQSLGVTADVKVEDWTLKGGARHIEQKNSNSEESFQTFIVGAQRALKLAGRNGSVAAEYEQDFNSSDRRRIALSGDLQVHEKVKIYARGERINSLSGVSGLSASSDAKDTIAIGVKSNFFKSTELFSEYRVRGGIDSRDLETASGVRGTYEISKGLSISPHLEIVNNLDGAGSDSIAASLAYKDSRQTDRVSSLRLETRHDDNRDYYGMQADYVQRLDERWSVLIKDTLRVESPKLGDDTLDNTFTVGLAYRPRRDNKQHALFFYQNKEKRGGENGDCSTHILSTHQNYEINEDALLSGRVGGKKEDCEGATSDAVVVDGRITWDLTNRLDVDVHAGVLGTDGVSEKNYSLGAGVNYLLRENLRLGMGYNVSGFKDEDLDPENYNDKGLYMGLQYKFDENSLNWLTGEK